MKPNNIKIDEYSYKNTIIYYNGYATIKDSKCLKIHSVCYFQQRGYFGDNNGNKYLTLVPTLESKEEIEKYKELWIKIRDLIRSITKNLDDYGEKYIKMKFNSDKSYL